MRHAPQAGLPPASRGTGGIRTRYGVREDCVEVAVPGAVAEAAAGAVAGVPGAVAGAAVYGAA